MINKEDVKKAYDVLDGLESTIEDECGSCEGGEDIKKVLDFATEVLEGREYFIVTETADMAIQQHGKYLPLPPHRMELKKGDVIIRLKAKE